MNNFDIIKSFGQGTVNLDIKSSLGNCASIGLIKASIEIFGLNNLFQISKDEDNYSVDLKDGTSINFNQNELNRSNEVIGFRLNEDIPEKLILFREIYEYAQICMCIMTKKVMIDGEAGEGIGDFESALVALNDGANTPTLPSKLGLQKYFSQPTWFLPTSNKAMIAWLRGHTVYMSQGYYDDYGKCKKITWRTPYIRRMRIIA
jgi:hypothetical protein